MAEYIRKAELLRRLDLLIEKALEVDCTRDATDGLNEAIDCVEEISPIHIVRCCECKWWDHIKNGRGACFSPRDDLSAAKTGKGYCVHRGGTSSNDFCSKAVKGKWEDRHKPEEVTNSQS